MAIADAVRTIIRRIHSISTLQLVIGKVIITFPYHVVMSYPDPWALTSYEIEVVGLGQLAFWCDRH